MNKGKGGRPNISKPDVGQPAESIGQQALEAKEAGLADVARLLASPDDLARLVQLRAEVSSKLTSARSTLSSGAAAQIEAAKYGLQLLDKSHRHIAKLRQCIDKIDHLCAECSTLVENHEKIRALSHAHANVAQVLEELGDIIDLPSRAAAVGDILASGDDGSFVAAFEGLTLLEGTANNIKEAWRRNAKKKADLGELAQYLTQVFNAMTMFERRLWSLARNYHALAQQQPRMLVDIARIVEMQEQMDAHYIATKATYVRPRHYKERLMLEMEAAASRRFAPLQALCGQHGQHNTKVKYDQDCNRVLTEARDYLGTLTDVERCDTSGRPLPGATDAELAMLQIREEDVFDEGLWLEALLGGFAALETELAEAYDFVSPCFPPQYNMFDSIFQMYHVQFAQALDTVGQVSPSLSTAGQLKLMQWVCGYQNTLRGLGMQEELVGIPVAPLSANSEGQPGFALLVDSYTDRMEATMTAWYKAILAQDLAGQPQQMSDGTLRTPGVIDFFRMLNEQVSVLEEISHGEVLLSAARRSLKLMANFVAAQQALLTPGGAAAALAGASAPPGGKFELNFEMVCAQINNSVDCYNQSLEFTEHVQNLLDEGYRSELDVEDTCRAFLDLAKAWAGRLVDMMYSDAGLLELWRKMYTSSDWLAGTTTATILATIGDYFNDITTFVEPGFCKRVCEGSLEEYARRACSCAVTALDKGVAAAGATLGGAAAEAADAVLTRLAQDEHEVQVFFEPLVPLDKLVKRVGQLAGLRELLSSQDPDGVVMGYAAVLELNPAITPAMVEKMLVNRPGWNKLHVADASMHCRGLYGKAAKRQQRDGHLAAGSTAAAGAAGGGTADSSKGWKLWGK
eukprot:GHRR01008074.1.p1 GENE.GHRR01008074.1~~GHRR01008074.1.p1  ORF type:complete len:855 (+),score=308.81 GHRR01008074.1:359-2923(+)